MSPRTPLAFFVVLSCVLSTATLARAASHAQLVTVGPGSDSLSLYGHSALCVLDDGAPDGRCYDFGVPVGDGDEAALVWDTVRGRPRFAPIAVERSLLVATFEDQERALWVQELPLAPSQVDALRASLDAAVAARTPYAYHPYFANCTTQLRDAIDAATAGKLRQGTDGPGQGSTFRALSEGGFSGHLFELAGVALLVGARADRVPTPWEAMFLPVQLRDAVATRLGAAPQQIYERREAVLATSTQAGRVGLVLLGAVLAGAIALGARRSARALQRALAVSGVLLGLLALAVDGIAAASRIPGVGFTWVLLALWPTDVLLAFLPAPRRSRYLQARLSVLALLASASATGLLAQPLVAVCAMAALPLVCADFVTRPRGKRAAARQPLR